MFEYETNNPRIKASDLHFWADWIELGCLQHPDHEITCADAISEHWRGRGLARDFMRDEEQMESEKGVDLGSETETEAERTDRVESEVFYLLKHLEVRADLLGDDYPFDVQSGEGYIRIRDDFTPNHVLYMFFLFAANLRFFPVGDRSALTKDFEILSAFALRTMLPNTAIIRSFSTVSHPIFEGYSGNKSEKLEALANDINTTHRTAGISPHDTGDSGFDIVAWYPFHDGASDMPTYFAQCGCTADTSKMFSKQGDVSSERVMNFFNRVRPVSLMFTPVCYRNGSGRWIQPHEIRSVFIDRIRLLRLLVTSLKNKERRQVDSLARAKATLTKLDIGFTVRA